VSRKIDLSEDDRFHANLIVFSPPSALFRLSMLVFLELAMEAAVNVPPLSLPPLKCGNRSGKGIVTVIALFSIE